MVEIRFQWALGEDAGSFTVSAPTVAECMESANEEIEKAGAELVDWEIIKTHECEMKTESDVLHDHELSEFEE